MHRHTKSPLEPFLIPELHFDQVHVDLVGSLLHSHGFTYLVTMQDRATRWPEVVPLSSTTLAVGSGIYLHQVGPFWYASRTYF